jgi:hypothetical protein
VQGENGQQAAGTGQRAQGRVGDGASKQRAPERGRGGRRGSGVLAPEWMRVFMPYFVSRGYLATSKGPIITMSMVNLSLWAIGTPLG